MLFGHHTTIGPYAFADSNIQRLDVPATWDTVPEGLCSNCELAPHAQFARHPRRHRREGL